MKMPCLIMHYCKNNNLILIKIWKCQMINYILTQTLTEHKFGHANRDLFVGATSRSRTTRRMTFSRRTFSRRTFYTPVDSIIRFSRLTFRKIIFIRKGNHTNYKQENKIDQKDIYLSECHSVGWLSAEWHYVGWHSAERHKSTIKRMTFRRMTFWRMTFRRMTIRRMIFSWITFIRMTFIVRTTHL